MNSSALVKKCLVYAHVQWKTTSTIEYIHISIFLHIRWTLQSGTTAWCYFLKMPLMVSFEATKVRLLSFVSLPKFWFIFMVILFTLKYFPFFLDINIKCGFLNIFGVNWRFFWVFQIRIVSQIMIWPQIRVGDGKFCNEGKTLYEDIIWKVVAINNTFNRPKCGFL